MDAISFNLKTEKDYNAFLEKEEKQKCRQKLMVGKISCRILKEYFGTGSVDEIIEEYSIEDIKSFLYETRGDIIK